MEEWMTVEEVSEFLGRTPRRIYQLLKDGLLTGEKVFGHWLIDPASVAERKRKQELLRSATRRRDQD